MASAILGAGAKLLGIGKKKAAPATSTATTTPQKGPIITQLGGSDQTAIALRRKLVTGQAAPGLFGQSNKLGG